MNTSGPARRCGGSDGGKDPRSHLLAESGPGWHTIHHHSGLGPESQRLPCGLKQEPMRISVQPPTNLQCLLGVARLGKSLTAATDSIVMCVMESFNRMASSDAACDRPFPLPTSSPRTGKEGAGAHPTSTRQVSRSLELSDNVGYLLGARRLDHPSGCEARSAKRKEGKEAMLCSQRSPTSLIWQIVVPDSRNGCHTWMKCHSLSHYH